MGMCVQGLRRIVLLAGLLVLAGACNQIDNVLPSGGTYQVDVLAGQFSLEECSVLAREESLLPYFVNPVAGDPDLRSLVIYVEGPEGNTLGRRVSYAVSDLPPDRQVDAGQTEAQEAGESSPDTGKELAIPVKSFDGKLPPFSLPEDLAIGSYSLVFEIRGERDVLSRMRRSFYYIGDREFAAGDIRCYLPGFYENNYVVPQGLAVLLETLVVSGEGLDPYVIWYNGKSRIGEGPLSAGAGRLLWTTPLRSGFHSIRAELFPFKPAADQKGRVKEFSLPVSQKVEKTGPGPAEKYLYRYQFAGDLLDTRTGTKLKPVNLGDSPLSWYPAEGVYGLVLGDGEAYEALRLPPSLLEQNEGDLCFFIRFLPLEEGRIFSARLGSSVRIGLSLAEGVLHLDLGEQEKESRISRALPESGRVPAFTGAFVVLRFEKAGTRAFLLTAASPAAGEAQGGEIFFPEESGLSEGQELDLRLPLNGELRSWIGAEVEGEDEENPQESPSGDPSAESSGPAAVSTRPVLVLEDFAALFRPLPDKAEDAEREGGEEPEGAAF